MPLVLLLGHTLSFKKYTGILQNDISQKLLEHLRLPHSIHDIMEHKIRGSGLFLTPPLRDCDFYLQNEKDLKFYKQSFKNIFSLHTHSPCLFLMASSLYPPFSLHSISSLPPSPLCSISLYPISLSFSHLPLHNLSLFCLPTSLFFSI